jgi:hypothetical protein
MRRRHAVATPETLRGRADSFHSALHLAPYFAHFRAGAGAGAGVDCACPAAMDESCGFGACPWLIHECICIGLILTF